MAGKTYVVRPLQAEVDLADGVVMARNFSGALQGGQPIQMTAGSLDYRLSNGDLLAKDIVLGHNGGRLSMGLARVIM